MGRGKSKRDCREGLRVCIGGDMKITRFNKGDLFIHIPQKKALELISSLSRQILRNDPNTERVEFYSNKGEYFTIAVMPEEAKQVESGLEINEYCQEWLDYKDK